MLVDICPHLFVRFHEYLFDRFRPIGDLLVKITNDLIEPIDVDLEGEHERFQRFIGFVVRHSIEFGHNVQQRLVETNLQLFIERLLSCGQDLHEVLNMLAMDLCQRLSIERQLSIFDAQF